MKFYEDAVYIKMCERAVEIQKEKNRIWEEGDFLHNGNYRYVAAIHDCCCGEMCNDPELNINKNDLTFVWLPRQDQLQEIANAYDWNLTKLAEYKVLIVDNYRVDGEKPKFKLYNGSIEQLFLIMIMKLKFNKTWNGEEWM